MDNTETRSTLRDKVLATIPNEAHVAFLRLALDAGVNDPDDAIWGDVALAYAASVSAQAAGDAARATQEQVAGIPDAIFQGTVKAGDDLRGQVEAAGKAVVEAAEQKAAQAAALGEGAITKSVEAGRGCDSRRVH